jgi:hypothetical protein
MTEDGLFVCQSRPDPIKEARMSEREEQRGTVVELLLREPEIVAWLEPERGRDDAGADDDYEPPRAA